MSAQISLQPMATTNAAGLFNTNSNGFTQGDALDDPAVKFALSGGVFSTDATTPLWGGVPITELIPTLQNGYYSQPQPGTDSLGGTIIQADGDAYEATGICVYNQAFSGITTPQSTAPLFSPGMSVNFYRFGSGARIPLPCDASIVALDGATIATTPIYWNPTTNLLTTTSGGAFAISVKVLRTSTANNKLVSYDGMAGTANWTSTGYIAVVLI
jgi:hypothetical protein